MLQSKGRKLRFLMAAMLAFVGTTEIVSRAPAAEVDLQAGTTVNQPISISIVEHMDFGTFTSPATAGTVLVPPSSNGSSVIVTGPIDHLGPFSWGRFTVTGTPSAAYSTTLPPSITVASGGDNMTVDSFVLGAANTGFIFAPGWVTFDLGATLHVSGNQPGGAYAGTFLIQVAYD